MVLTFSMAAGCAELTKELGLDREPPVEEQVVLTEDESDVSEEESAESAPPPPPRRKPELIERQQALAAVTGETDPETLIGMDPIKAVRLLGAPDEVREEPPATVWAFKDETCAVELYFYLDLENERLKTLGYEIYADEDTDEARQACLNRLVNRGRDEGEAKDV